MDGKNKHALITVKHGDEVLSTEQFGGRDVPTNGVSTFDPETLPSLTINVRVPLPNPGGAMAYAEAMMAKTERGVYPPYHPVTQSCVTYCAKVLQAGGVEDISTRSTIKAIEWLLEQHG